MAGAMTAAGARSRTGRACGNTAVTAPRIRRRRGAPDMNVSTKLGLMNVHSNVLGKRVANP
jgi:hypothetical protein